VQNPIACSLSADGARERVDEWRGFFASSVDDVERAADERFRFRLVSDPGALAGVVDLAQREKACCPFFDFSIEVEADRCWLVVGVPTEATGVLADFARLAEAGRG
jgi:hypothetical protein